MTGVGVNSEAKPFASLSSGLLARKGAARPAMRPQGFGQMGAGLEDLGWNDMGFEPPKPAETPDPDFEHDGFGEVVPAHPHNLAGLTPVDSPVHDQQAQLAGRLSAYTPDDAGEELDETAEPYEPQDEDENEVGNVLARGEETAKQDVLQPVAPEVQARSDTDSDAEPGGPEPMSAEPIEPAPPARFPALAAPRRTRKARSQPGAKGKAAFTLRLDPDRHLKLRLACAVDGRSAQLLVTQALDDFLAGMPELDTMAEKAKRKG